MTPEKQLAAEVLAMFEVQREYFKTRNPEQLNRCKATEAALKKKCKAILDGTATDERSLFDGKDG